jgi:HAMP domain-containing protein
VFKRTETPMRCRKYEARLEDALHGVIDSGLRQHLDTCARCRAALEDARLANSWLRQAWEPTGEAPSVFLAGVMARIRNEEKLAASPAAFWSPLEFLASRISVTAAVLLLALSLYMLEFTPRRTVTPTRHIRTELSASDFPQVPSDPVENDEILQSLAERDYGR